MARRVSHNGSRNKRKSLLERKLDELAAEGWLHRGNGRRIGKIQTFKIEGVLQRLMAERR